MRAAPLLLYLLAFVGFRFTLFTGAGWEAYVYSAAAAALMALIMALVWKGWRARTAAYEAGAG